MATRAYLNNSRKSDKSLYEELDQAIHTVVRRAFFGDKRSSASEYVTNNLFPAFGRRYDASEGPLHLYRMGISNTKVTKESLDGRNSVLRSSRVPRFPDAVLEDLFSNLRFVYIFSGTGWLNALNNLDCKYQAKYLYVPDRYMEKEIHEAIRAAGGIDIQLLGIGRNGHIGFNEPAADFTYGTHVVTLTENTIEANARFFASADDVPRQAISMGIGNIMNARCVVLVATGKSKAEAVYRTICGPITPEVPASILQLHPCCVILTDTEAASLMRG